MKVENKIRKRKMYFKELWCVYVSFWLYLKISMDFYIRLIAIAYNV